MSKQGSKDFRAFTTTDKRGLARSLITKVQISAAFDPQETAPEEQPPFETFNAIWDTGATACVITQDVVDKCSLKPSGMVRACHADGEGNFETCLVNIGLPNKVAFSNVKVTQMGVTSADVLIGMDIITQGDFAVTNTERTTVFSFRVPSIQRINYVAEGKATTQGRNSEVARNAPCPCGSGKKYKKCCGKD